MTITDAIKKVLAQKSPQTASEIFDAIVAASLFEFKSKAARSIVRSQIRRHCEGTPSKSLQGKPAFRMVGYDKYELIK